MSFFSSIEKVTEAKWYKVMMPKLYGWGASIVILGALFKIENFPGASIMLAAGLGIEAIIFFFSAFEKQAADPDWSLVYPELAGMEDPAKKSPAQQLDDALEKAKIDNELVESYLTEGVITEGLMDAVNRVKQGVGNVAKKVGTAASGAINKAKEVAGNVKTAIQTKIQQGRDLKSGGVDKLRQGNQLRKDTATSQQNVQ